MSKKEGLHISEGFTLEEIGTGISAIIIGFIILFTEVYILGILLIIVGLFLGMSLKGHFLDVSNNRIKSYIVIFFIRIGRWESIEGYEKIVYTSSKGKNDPKITNWRTHGGSSIRSYYLTLNGENKELLINEFVDYKKGRELARKISEYLDLTLVDEISIARKLSLKRRENRKGS